MSNLDLQFKSQIAAGDFLAAKKMLTAALASDNRNANLHYNLGFVLRKLGSFDDAGREFLLAIKLNPNLAEGHIGYATVMLEKRDYRSARSHYEAALKLKPDDTDILIGIANCNELLGDADQALDFLLARFTVSPSNLMARTISELSRRCGRTDKIASYSTAISANSTSSVDLLRSSALLAMLSGCHEKAIEAYHRWHAVRQLGFRTNPITAREGAFSSPYTAEQPSPRYGELISQYQTLHRKAQKEGTIIFDGIESFSIIAPFLREFVRKIIATDMLDYGGGRGKQYTLQAIEIDGIVYENILAYLGVNRAACFDPGANEVGQLQQYDLVACVDALEHCDRLDLPWIVRQLFQTARKGVFANIASYKAGKTLPNGENAHCTVEPAEWWMELFAAIAAEFPTIDYRVIVTKDAKLRNSVGFCR